MTNIFISHPTPYNEYQEKFLRTLGATLEKHGLNPVNLGKNNWSYKAPLEPIKKIMSSCKGALIVGLERTHSYIGYEKEGVPQCKEFVHRYLSSPWIQIEAGMAYQLGLPLLILKENKLHSEGILDPNVSEFAVFQFELQEVCEALSPEISSVIESWVQDID